MAGGTRTILHGFQIEHRTKKSSKAFQCDSMAIWLNLLYTHLTPSHSTVGVSSLSFRLLLLQVFNLDPTKKIYS